MSCLPCKKKEKTHGGKYLFRKGKAMLNSRRVSTPDVQIHVNPNRPKTPNPIRPKKEKRDPSPSVQAEDDEYEIMTDGITAESRIFKPRSDTPAAPSYGSMGVVGDTTPLLNGDGVAGIEGESDADEDSIANLPFFSKQNFKRNKHLYMKQLKITVLILGALISSIFIVINEEHEEVWNQISLTQNSPETVVISDHPEGQNFKKMHLILRGPFQEMNESVTNDSEIWITVLIASKPQLYLSIIPGMMKNWTFESVIADIILDNNTSDGSNLNITLVPHNFSHCVPIDFSYYFTTISRNSEISAAIVLVLVYGLIILELVHRTLAAILGSLAAIAVMSAFAMRPTLEKIMTWLDIETLALLFGMMIIVAIFSETGFFDYCALQAYKLAKGKVWPLITLLCVFSAVVSAFLDNVTTILLLTPVTIRLCEVLNLDPRKILIAEVLFSNIGGTATAIGDPPNVIIVSDKTIQANGIDFARFSGHMSLGILFCALAGYGLLRLTYRKMSDLENKDPQEIMELRHEIEMWKRAAMRMIAVSREENIMKAIFSQKVAELENKLAKKIYKMKRRNQKNFREMLAELETKYKITNKALLVKSGLVLAGVILLFFLHSFITTMHVGLGWIAIMGAIWLMVLADMQELEVVLHRVEWSTLIFFAALFTLMEALKELGLIDLIGNQVKTVIKSVDCDYQLLVAMVIILWVSALASSFIDNIPFTTAMVPILHILHEDVHVPLLPMVLALAFGACLGGNGTLIGASANVVAAGIAEQHGYGFSFTDFFKVGFPMMLVTTLVANIYLILCHYAVNWDHAKMDC